MYCVFLSRFGLRFPNTFLGKFLLDPIVGVVARRSASVIRQDVDYYCVDNGSRIDYCLFFSKLICN